MNNDLKKLMKKILNNIAIFLLLIGSLFFYKEVVVEPKIKRLQTELRKSTIKKDSLRKVSEGYYKKVVADTLTKRELKKIIDSLELKVKTPTIVQVIKTIPKIVEKPIDGLYVDTSTVKIEDYYPSKENPFIRYNTEIDLQSKEGIGKFTPYPIDIVLAIGQREDGTYELDTKLPEFFNITSIDVQALPMKPNKKDNFGLLLGGGMGKDFYKENTYMRVNTGIRYKKTYLQLGGNTNETLDLTLTFEF